MSKAVNHIHRYKKVNLSRKKEEPYLVYQCTKPLCSHYVPMAQAEGKMCECNRCGEAMIIGRSTLVHSGGKPMAKPHCNSCVKRRAKAGVEDIAAFLSKTGV